MVYVQDAGRVEQVNGTGSSWGVLQESRGTPVQTSWQLVSYEGPLPSPVRSQHIKSFFYCTLISLFEFFFRSSFLWHTLSSYSSSVRQLELGLKKERNQAWRTSHCGVIRSAPTIYICTHETALFALSTFRLAVEITFHWHSGHICLLPPIIAIRGRHLKGW